MLADVRGFFAVGQFAVRKMLVSVRLGQIRLGFFFLTMNCPTAKNSRAVGRATEGSVG